MIAFKDNNDGYYQFNWDGVSELPEWTKGMTAVEVVAVPIPIPVPVYQKLRAAAYPPVTDYLDGIVKGDAAQVQAYIDACMAVKQEFPK